MPFVNSVASPKHSSHARQSNSSTPPPETQPGLIPGLPDDVVKKNIIPYLAPLSSDTYMPGYDEGKELANLARLNNPFRQFIQDYLQKDDGFYQKLTAALRLGTPLRQRLGITLPPYLLPAAKRPKLSNDLEQYLDHTELLKYHRPVSELTDLCNATFAMHDKGLRKAVAIIGLAENPNLSTAQLDTLVDATHTVQHKLWKAYAIEGLAKNPNLSTAQLGTLLTTINAMQHDRSLPDAKAEAIRALAQHPKLSPTQLGTLVNVFNTMQGGDHADAIRALTENPSLFTEQLNTLVDAITRWLGDQDYTTHNAAENPNLSVAELYTHIENIRRLPNTTAHDDMKEHLYRLLDQLPTTT
jgi:hypothetical protein